MFKRIAFIKTGWSDDYQGGTVDGRHEYISDGNRGHERFNFLPFKGKYYASVPGGAPQPKDSDGWLLIFVAARKGLPGLTVVGWYENATIEREFVDRPEYAGGGLFETDSESKRYKYCVSAPTAHLIPVGQRKDVIKGDHMGRTSIAYARGNDKHGEWRDALAAKAIEIVRRPLIADEAEPPEVRFPDQEHRKQVESAAIDHVKGYYEKKKFDCVDRQREKCGYDLFFKHRKSGEELHVEVKGTSLDFMHFYMSKNEFLHMENPKWRLAVVTDALKKPTLNTFTNTDAKKTFRFEPFAYEGILKKAT